MKTTLIVSALLTLGASGAPTEYGPPKGGWENVKYPPGTGGNCNIPFTFTSTYSVTATPDQVVNGTTPTGGLPGSSGLHLLGVNAATNTICYNITFYGFRGEYQSPAKTATHMHEAARGASGPPRIAFPNPVTGPDPNVRNAVGCLTGPFETGVKVNGVDTGANFHVRQIEANPAGFFVDVHSSLVVPGAFRGQLA